MLAKLGNLDTAESTEYLTAIVNGFGKEANEAADIVSKLIALDNMAATSAGEIATAMQYSSAVANETGVSFENLAAMITNVSSSTRLSGEMIGTAFRSMFIRMQQVKSGAIDETGMSLNNVEKSLANVNIKLRDSVNSFRPLEDVIADVAEKWDTLDEVTKAQISNAIAGQRQAQIFSSLMQNWGDMEGYVAAETTSAGLAQERYGIYLEGVEAAQKRLTAETERFWQDGISSGNIAKFYDFLALLVEGVNYLGGMETIIVLLIAAFTAFIPKIWASVVAMEAFNLTNPIGWVQILIVAIYGAVKAYQALVPSIEKVNEKLAEQEEFVRGLKDAQGKSKEGIERLKELGSKSRTADEESEFKKLQNDLKELMPELEGYYDIHGDFVVDLSQDFKSLNDEMQKTIDLEEQRKQQLRDQSAELYATEIMKEYREQLSANAPVRKARGLSDESIAEANEKWAKALNEMRLNFEKMSDEGKQKFIDSLIASGENGKRLAEEIFIPLMNKIDEVKDKIENNPAQMKVDVVVSDEAKEAFDEIIEMTMDMIKQKKEAERDALKEEIDNLEELADAQKEIYDEELESIKRNAEEAKRLINEQYEEQKRMLEDRKRAIENELDDYLKIIDAERDRLKAAKDRADFERSQQEKTEDLATLEAQIAELALDNSAEAIAKRKELEAQAAELRKDIAEEQSDYEYNLQLEALKFEEDKAKSEAEILLRQLELEAQAYEDRHDRMIQEIDDAVYEAERRHDILVKSVDDELQAKKKGLEEQIKAIDEYLKQEGTIRQDALKMMKEDNKALFEELLEWNKKYGTGLDETIIAMWEKAKEAVEEYTRVVLSAPPPPVDNGGGGGSQTYKAFHSGADVGFVGGTATLSSNEQFAKLMRGELVVNSSQMENFMKNVLPSMMGSPATVSNRSGDIKVEMPINVSGNLDKTVIPSLEKMVDAVVRKLNDNLLSRGMNRRADAFSI